MILLEHVYRGDVWRIEVSDYQGRQFVNFRRWYRDADGELKPSRDGFTCPVERLAELLAAILAFLDGKPVNGKSEAA